MTEPGCGRAQAGWAGEEVVRGRCLWLFHRHVVPEGFGQVAQGSAFQIGQYVGRKTRQVMDGCGCEYT
jgi:hypothetical protein